MTIDLADQNGNDTGLTTISEIYYQAFEEATLRLSKQSASIAVTTLYHSWEAPETRRGVYIGMKEIKKNEDQLSSIAWIEDDGLVRLSASVILVETLKELPIGTPVQIAFLGKKPTASGFKVNSFEVRLLIDDSNSKQSKPQKKG